MSEIEGGERAMPYASFLNCIYRTLEFEGNYSKNPSDPGGETKFGISKRFHPDLDIKNITLQEAINIYHKEYWVGANLCNLYGQDLISKIFDLGVLLGHSRVVKFLQELIVDLYDIDLKVDGILGKETRGTMNRYVLMGGEDLLLHGLCGRAGEYIKKIAIKDKGQFRRGWLWRVYS